MSAHLTQAAEEGVERAQRVVHTKPFNRAHAKAGAPFCGDKGQRLVIMAWDRNHPSHPIVGMEVDGDQEVIAFRDDGETDHNCGFLTKRLVMTPLGHLDGKPVFMGDALANANGTIVSAFPEIDLVSPLQAWSWPAPAKVYPETRMTFAEMEEVWHVKTDGMTVIDSARVLANAALRHAIDAGQVVSIEDHAAELTRATMSGQDLANDQMRADYKQQSMELGKAERLLESHGYRSVGNGDWQRGASPVKCFYGHPKKGLYVEGDKASIDKVTAIVARAEKRDMAVAEAVRDACVQAGSENCAVYDPLMAIVKLVGDDQLKKIIDGVKP